MRRVSAERLLGALSGGVVPVDTGDEPRSGAFSSFVRAHRDAIRFDPGLGTNALDPETMERAARAFDDASREGFDRALLDIGDAVLRVDVRRRRVEAHFWPGEGFVVGGIDGVVRAPAWGGDPGTGNEGSSGDPGDAEAAPGSSPRPGAPSGSERVPLPARVVRNASLAEALVLDDVPDA